MKVINRAALGVSTLLVFALVIPAMGSPDPADSAAITRAATLHVNPGEGGYELSLNGGAAFHVTSNEVRNERLVEVPGSPTLLVLWDELSADGLLVPFYAISLDGQTIARVRQTSYVLKLRHGDFDPTVAVPPIGATLAAGADCNLYIVQFVTQPLEAFRAQIEELGGTVYHFLANHAHIVRMSPTVREAVAALPYVRWVGPYHPAHRLEELMRDNWDRADELFPLQRYNIQVFEAGLKQKHAVAERIRAMGGLVNMPDAGKYLLEATLTPEQLLEVVHWDEVLFVDHWSPYQPDMNNARELGGANYIETVAGYTGAGVRGEVLDIGFNLSHVDFVSRPLILHTDVDSDSHGASTSGIVFGDGTGNPMARGMLPDGQGIVADWDVVSIGTPRYIHTGELVQDPYYAVFQTASVGSDRTIDYTTISADTDAALFDFDIVHCQSQSNAGDQMSRPQAWAKNIISCGGIYHYDTLTMADDCWCSGASIGPAYDGRIKPDVSAFYDEIFTVTTGSDTAYTSDFGGTSGATPIVAGHVGLFFQMWADGIFGNEVDPDGTVFDNRAHMTTAKAMVINTAIQYPFSGSTHDLTRVHQGWGWPSMQNMYDLREKMFIVDEAEVLEPFQTAVYPLAVQPDEPALRATLVYADLPGTTSSSQHRINDLTLKVTSPSGTVYWGNNGLLEGNWSTPGGGPNTIDTVENVFIQSPEQGVWIIEISADEINQDSHVETPDLDADFALVVSGVTPCSSRGAIGLNRSAYQCEDTAELRVVDCDLNADDAVEETVEITIASDSEPGGEMLVLSETGAATAVFLGEITLSETDAAGVLYVADGDTVTATYIDEDDGMGGVDVEVTDTAVVDCDPPSIANVEAMEITARSARVTFDSDEPVRGRVFYGLSCDALELTASTATYDMSPVITLSGLNDGLTYYYAVMAEDRAGNRTYDDNGGSCYWFTTPDVPNFFTEEFGGDNDLDNLTFLFEPNGSIDYYAACVEEITELPTDPSGGTSIYLSDDDYQYRSLSGGETISLYGVHYNGLYVGSNGYLTFTGGDTEYNESLGGHFDTPRVSGLFDDLNPSSGGTVWWQQLEDRAVVTWQNVPEYGMSNSNTFQIEMYFDGDIRISYLAIAASDGIAGLSEGNGVDPDFYETDLSEVGSCGPKPPEAVNDSVSTPANTPVTVTLEARDDGLPEPPHLDFIIGSLPEHGTLSDPGADVIESMPYTLVDGGNQVVYTPDTWFLGEDYFQFYANDGGEPPEGGNSNIATVVIDVTPPASEVIYEFRLDSDPRWTTEGQWAFGQPTGGGSHNHDPSTGHTGENVYGYNLYGDYSNDMPAYYLTASAIDCRDLLLVELRFWRWLGVERDPFDHATVEVSNDGTNWTEVWSNPTSSISDSSWSPMMLDVSAVADGQATVYVRWGMGPTDEGVTYPGWNIDDVEIWAVDTSPECPGDLDGDGDVDLADLSILLTHYGMTSGAEYEDGDLDGDGDVDLTDLSALLAVYGTTCP